MNYIDKFLVKDGFDNSCEYCMRFELFDMLNDPLLLFYADTGVVIYMNEKARILYGYTLDEIKNLHITQIAYDQKLVVENRIAKIKQAGSNGNIFSTCHQKKNGEIMMVQVNAKYIKLHGSRVIAAIIRDMTQDAKIRNEIKLTGKMQRILLPPDFSTELVEMKSIYKPHYFVSGDSYGYSWYTRGKKLFGYLIDVMGSGFATALQASAMKVLFQQAATLDIPLIEKMHWINKQSMKYFWEESFAAAICFVIDFKHKSLICTSGGINYFLHTTNGKTSAIKIPGSFLGITENAEYEHHIFSLEPGDIICFLSDGLYELIPDINECPADFNSQHEWLKNLTKTIHLRDDASGICFKILPV